MKAHTAETQATVTPAKALEFLKEGNQRFIKNLRANRDLLEQVNATKDGQFPFAVILSCIDSRTSAELIFDQGLGDIFSARVAGNVINEDILGSMEYSCKVAGSKLIVVLGHSKCGAVTSACKGAKMGNITALLSKMQDSIGEVNREKPNADASSPEFVEAVAHHNVIHTMDEILKRSSVLKEMFDAGEIGIAGAYYNVDSGEVEFIKEVLHD
ncbi:carbonic anhydrase family protein [Sinomicrobium weinanense]|uniref:Carbonic anhydrase n=1 Tax=Sinomicrobium weinanense TaxID=2842200 RepID=A0A926JN54_9FLAO|nr:carbonic anhydrase family protein [Sinomicrobium weinanense]MBC9794345.1 carbonic anhydrase [Sinomicrobium weinanense]MBU3124252.1 carbonic anhydrase [Sinomicrobium weinanense]